MMSKNLSRPEPIDKSYRWEGLIFNGVCILYFIFLSPKIAKVASSAMRDPDARPIWLGIILIVITLLEIYALPVKMRFVRWAIRKHGDKGNSGMVLWMFHAVLSIIILFTIAGSFGLKIGSGEGETDIPWWMSLLLVATVIKELAFLMFMLGSGDDLPKGKYERPSVKERLIDLVLVIYACLGYTVIWGSITIGLSMERQNTPMYIINLFVAGLLFLVFYLPLRIPYLIEERAQIKSGSDELRFCGSILAVMIPAIWVLS